MKVEWTYAPPPAVVRTRSSCLVCDEVVDEQEGPWSSIPTAGHEGHEVEVTLTYEDGAQGKHRVVYAGPRAGLRRGSGRRTRPPVDDGCT